MQGLELGEPCKFLAGRLLSTLPADSTTAPKLIAGLTHRAGLRARIVAGGIVRTGDPIVVA